MSRPKDQKLIAGASQPPAAFSRRDAILLGGLGLVACLVAADVFLNWRGNGDHTASKPLLKPVKPLAEAPKNAAAPKLDEAPAGKANSEPVPAKKHKQIYDRVTNEEQQKEVAPGNESAVSKSPAKPKAAAAATPQKKQILDRLPQ